MRDALGLWVAISISGCATAGRPAPPPTPESRAAATMEVWTRGLADPEQLGGEDLRGQAALLYGGLRAVGAGDQLGLQVGMLVTNALVCALPILAYFAGTGCDEDYKVRISTGPLAPVLRNSGIARISQDGKSFEIRPSEILAGTQKLAAERRRRLVESGAGSCRVAQWLGQWRPPPIAADPRCSQHAAAPPLSQDESGRCFGDLILWNAWQADVDRVWIVRLDCAGAPGVALLSAGHRPGERDRLLLIALAAEAEAVWRRWEAMIQ